MWFGSDLLDQHLVLGSLKALPWRITYQSLVQVQTFGGGNDEWAQRLHDISMVATQNFMDYCGTLPKEVFIEAHRAMLRQRLPLATTVGLHGMDQRFWEEVLLDPIPKSPPAPIMVVFHFGWLPTVCTMAAAFGWRPTVLINREEEGLFHKALEYTSPTVDLETLSTGDVGVLIRAAQSLRRGRTLFIAADVSAGQRTGGYAVDLPKGSIALEDGPFQLARMVGASVSAIALQVRQPDSLSLQLSMTPAYLPDESPLPITRKFVQWLSDTPAQWLAWRYLTPIPQTIEEVHQS
ncbi:MAG: hypothetical protein M1499_08685 [Firmicutes bacterium]|nr:hypothetical protein [Bacillota bacterium]